MIVGEDISVLVTMTAGTESVPWAVSDPLPSAPPNGLPKNCRERGLFEDRHVDRGFLAAVVDFNFTTLGMTFLTTSA